MKKKKVAHRRNMKPISERYPTRKELQEDEELRHATIRRLLVTAAFRLMAEDRRREREHKEQT